MRVDLNGKASVGVIQGGTTRTVKVKLKPKKTGRIKASSMVTSENAGAKTVKKKIRVKKSFASAGSVVGQRRPQGEAASRASAATCASVRIGQSDGQSDPVPGAGNRPAGGKEKTQDHLRNRSSQVRILSGALSKPGAFPSSLRSSAALAKSAPFGRNRRSCPQAE